METRTVKFNAKDFIEDFIFYKESREEEKLFNLIVTFDSFLKSCPDNVKRGLGQFLSNNKVAMQYVELQGFALTCML